MIQESLESIYKRRPTKSYRSKHPFKVVGEVTNWQSHSPEQLETMRNHLKKLKEMGIEAIED